MIYRDNGINLIRADGLSVPKDEGNADYREAITTGTILPKLPATKLEAKAAALAVATAAGFSLDQVRILRAVILLLTGTPQQKTKAQALLVPLLKLFNDAKAVVDAIDADTVPPVITPPILGTDDP